MKRVPSSAMLCAVLGLLLVCGAAAAAAARDISDEEYAAFPRLYHLDDMEACLARRGGLYCLGTFAILPARHHDPLYNTLKEYSSNPYHFNRTLLHRGYCVSERCRAPERNVTLRFERCAAHTARRRRLRVALHELVYCRSHAQEFARRHSSEPLELAARLLLAACAALLFLAVVGTLYDVRGGPHEKKHDVLAVWSIRSNWRRLTATYEDGDPRLAALTPVQGVRVFLMFLIIGTHAACIHDMLYLQNPRYVEQAAKTPVLMAFMNGTSVVMVFVLVSSFLLAYNLLLLSTQRPLHQGMLKWCLVKRIARISPVSLVVTGFAATLWPRLARGPQWPALVEREAAVCRAKFWAHALYLNNLWRPDDHCLVQTWFLATDMQLYVVASALTLWLGSRRRRALPVLAALLLASCLLNGALAYLFDWKSLMYHVYPETLHTMYRGVASFYRLYTAPWGSLPACLLGLLLAHLHFQLHERGCDLVRLTWFRWAYTGALPAMLCWLVAGHWLRAVEAREFTALYAAVERPVLSLLSALVLLGLFNKMPGFLQNFFSWSGWHAMGRMSLAVLMVHWLVNTYIAASRPQPLATSLLDVSVDTAATAVLSYLLAVPLTLLVEMPLTRAVGVLILRQADQHKQKAA